MFTTSDNTLTLVTGLFKFNVTFGTTICALTFGKNLVLNGNGGKTSFSGSSTTALATVTRAIGSGTNCTTLQAELHHTGSTVMATLKFSAKP